ncbi:STAS/SEC14 domain-containing protein [Cesiribacter sp. SM1]|uniref:STAS/SEC14 domain-containing protein n=1 Tax=Cesiribacter sp. SM1 TaxID=2861196 RepID=UPI001CD2F95C|nr:STAS/SEC14 domain-containing protein [Cesiribacter sp. SM1]
MKLEVKNKLGEVYYSAQYNSKDNCVVSEWRGYVSAEEVIAAVQQVMDSFGDLKFSNSLNDSSKGEGSWDEANDWLAKNWIPYAIANGLKRFAFIVSDDVFSAMSSDDLVTKIPGAGLEMRTFQTRAEGEAWLKSA